MTMLSSCWTKAALLGSLWAAVEIVLGSFLHNIGMPLTGTVLSALGVCLMVAGGQLWSDRGIIWRAGVLCALMKSVSPSAVIIGPMIGITLEAFLLDGMTRLLGRTAPGYILGGALATTLPVFQKLIGLVFTYGPDAARLYVAMYESAARTLRITAPGPLDLLLVWLGLNLLLGGAAAVLGMRAGRHAQGVPDLPSIRKTDQTTYSLGSPDPGQLFSLPLLAGHALLVPFGLIAIRDLQLSFSGPAVIVYAVGMFARYRRIRRRFSRPRPWIEFTLMALLAGFFLGELTASPEGGPWTGVQIGLQMALRAVLVVVAFSAISIELRNPMVARWFLRRGLSPVSAALDVAFQALPAMMRAIGEERKFLRHPMTSVARVLAAARAWLGTTTPDGTVFLITGPQGSGKTSFLLALAEELRGQGKTPGGIAAPVVLKGSERIGYDLLDLKTGERVTLARKNVTPTGMRAGPFAFLPAAIAFGEQALASAAARRTCVIALDEIGPLELAGKGWSPALSALLSSPPGVLLLVIRPDLIGRVTERWNLKPAHIWKPGEATPGDAVRQLIATLPCAAPQ
jgi:nucleoside-triphosphatase THEP1